jgi:uncharacterized protein YndB with AHSA1/START domain
MSTTRITRHLRAPRAAVYAALLDRDAYARWMVPPGMRCEIHELDAREGGAFRVSLTYEAPTDAGKSAPQTDTYHGRFTELVPDRRVVRSVEFETSNPALQGEMRITIDLSDAAGGGTELVALHENLPSGVAPRDNELGWQQSLAKLAALVER